MICPVTFSDNGNIVQDKTAIRVLEQSAVLLILWFLISAVFLWTLLLLPTLLPPFLFSLILLPQGSCVLFFGYCSVCYFIFKLFSVQLELDVTGNGEGKRYHSSPCSEEVVSGEGWWGTKGFAWMETVTAFLTYTFGSLCNAVSMGMPLLTCLGKWQ